MNRDNAGRHIILPTSKEQQWARDRDGNRHIVEEAIAIAERPSELVQWLDASWNRTGRAYYRATPRRFASHRMIFKRWAVRFFP